MFWISPASAKTLVPLLFSVPMPANHSPPLRMIGGDVGEGLHVVDERGVAPKPFLARDRAAAVAACPRLPSIDAISAVSSPQTKAPAPIRISMRKLNARAADVAAQQAEPLRLPDGDLQPLDGQRVLGAHVDVALRCAPTA